MNKLSAKLFSSVSVMLTTFLCLATLSNTMAQSFDFASLNQKAADYTVVVEMKVELSFGMQSNEHEQRMVGTIVTAEGLVIFDGGIFVESNPLLAVSSFGFRATPTRIEIQTLDGEKYLAEYIGVDRDTRLAFAKITDANDMKFSPVEFTSTESLIPGHWLAVLMLLPDFVEPPLGADIGMISVLTTSPEPFALTVGFNALEITGVLYDGNLDAVGVLGELVDPSFGEGNGGPMLEGMGRFSAPLLGVVTPDKINPLIADPPRKGEIDRAWLGITLQALTPDIAEFLNVDVPGGIIINDIVGDSPAERSGLQIGDVIYQVNGQEVAVDQDEKLPLFQRRIAQMGAGTSVELSILRPVGEQIDSLPILVVLERAPMAAADAESYEDERLEMKVRDLVFADFIHLNLEQGSVEGVLISDLKPAGLAYIGGLQVGDVIHSVNGQDIVSVEVISALMESLSKVGDNTEEIIFFVRRGSKTMFVNVKAE